MDIASQTISEEFLELHLKTIRSWKSKAKWYSVNKNTYVCKSTILASDVIALENEMSFSFPSQVRRALIKLGECDINSDITILALRKMDYLQVPNLGNHVAFALDSKDNYLTFNVNDSSKSKIYYIDPKTGKGILVSDEFSAIVNLLAVGKQAFSKFISEIELCKL